MARKKKQSQTREEGDIPPRLGLQTESANNFIELKTKPRRVGGVPNSAVHAQEEQKADGSHSKRKNEGQSIEKVQSVTSTPKSINLDDLW